MFGAWPGKGIVLQSAILPEASQGFLEACSFAVSCVHLLCAIGDVLFGESLCSWTIFDVKKGPPSSRKQTINQSLLWNLIQFPPIALITLCYGQFQTALLSIP